MSDLRAELALDLGASGGSLIGDLLAKIHVGINDSVVEMRKANENEQRRLASIPNNVVISRGSQATTTDLLDFGGPQPGRQWSVRLLVGVSNDGTNNATVATWYVGPKVPVIAAGILPGTMVRYQMPSLPSVQKFGGEIIVQPNERLMVGLTGIPASSSLAFSAAIDDQILDNARYTVAL